MKIIKFAKRIFFQAKLPPNIPLANKLSCTVHEMYMQYVYTYTSIIMNFIICYLLRYLSWYNLTLYTKYIVN